MNPKGNVWFVCGRRDTGKSHESLEIATYFRERPNSPKRTVIIDHTDNNDTYGHIKKIDLSDLDFALPQRGIVRVGKKDRITPFDWKLCEQKIMNLHNCTVVFDDVTSTFSGTVSENILTFCGLAKNQRLEIIFQFHTVSDTAPKLLRASNMLLIKQTQDVIPLKKSCPDAVLLANLLTKTKELNNKDMSHKWNTFLFDRDEETVKLKNLKQAFPRCYGTKPVSMDEYL